MDEKDESKLLTCRIKRWYGTGLAWAFAFGLLLGWLICSLWGLNWFVSGVALPSLQSGEALGLIIVFFADLGLAVLGMVTVEETSDRTDLAVGSALAIMGSILFAAKIAAITARFSSGIVISGFIAVVGIAIGGYALVYYLCELEKALIRTAPVVNESST